MTQRIENAFSRIPNGNFSHGPAFWSARIPPSPAPLPTFLVEWNGGYVTGPGTPRYLLRSDIDFWVDIPYRDLLVYPSVVDYRGALQPASLSEVYLFAIDKYANCKVYPFQSYDGKQMNVGDPVYVDDTVDGAYTGEYRSKSVVSAGVLKAVASTGLVAVQDDESFDTMTYMRNAATMPTTFQVKVNPAVSADVVPGTFFVSMNPTSSGMVQAVSIDRKTLYISVSGPHTVIPDTGGAWVPMGLGWGVFKGATILIRRKMPVCLYDLTLAYTMKDGASLAPGSVALEFYDEVGVLVKTVTPEVIGTAGAKYISKAVATGYTRYVLRFMAEAAEPYYGSIKVHFGDGTTGPITRIGDVVLFRGDYVEQLPQPPASLTGKTFDYLEQNVCQESEIIPRGTVIAYVGGSVCPSGYTRVEGIGRIDNNNADAPDVIGTTLYTTLAQQYGSRTSATGEPRTYVRFTSASPVRTDIVAGMIFEFFYTNAPSSYAVISAAGLVRPDDPNLGPFENSGMPWYEIELAGDFLHILQSPFSYRIWTAGMIAHVQGARDLGDGNGDSGGERFIGKPHTHMLAASPDLKQLSDVGWPSDTPGVVDANVFVNHDHFPLWSASALPKVRPVLLCQKI